MTRTYLDAGVLIAGVRGTPVRADVVVDLIQEPGRVFVASAFLRLEVLPKAIYHRNRIEIAFYEDFFARVVAWAEPTELVVAQAEREAARHGLNALDTLHAAAAALLDADELVTTETPRRPIHRATSVKVVSIRTAAAR